MAWNDLGRGAEPSQTLGPDSLGGVGTAEFEVQGDTTIALVARTFRGLPRFEECATCPHVFTVRRFEWHGPSFLKTEERAVPSPYSSFVRFVLGVAANDGSALRWCSGPEVLELARNYDLGVAQRGIWRAAPATDESAHEMVFFRGQQEAYRVGFEMRGDQWVISGITPTTRTVE
jgi:hypothetical protein